MSCMWLRRTTACSKPQGLVSPAGLFTPTTVGACAAVEHSRVFDGLPTVCITIDRSHVEVHATDIMRCHSDFPRCSNTLTKVLVASTKLPWFCKSTLFLHIPSCVIARASILGRKRARILEINRCPPAIHSRRGMCQGRVTSFIRTTSCNRKDLDHESLIYCPLNQSPLNQNLVVSKLN